MSDSLHPPLPILKSNFPYPHIHTTLFNPPFLPRLYCNRFLFWSWARHRAHLRRQRCRPRYLYRSPALLARRVGCRRTRGPNARLNQPKLWRRESDLCRSRRDCQRGRGEGGKEGCGVWGEVGCVSCILESLLWNMANKRLESWTMLGLAAPSQQGKYRNGGRDVGFSWCEHSPTPRAFCWLTPRPL